MAKKKSVKKKTADSEMIHFRPGKELGSLIGQFSEQEGISRGEAAKRLTGLAIRCLDVGFYGLVEELSAFLFHSGNFDSACDQVYVAVEAIASKENVDVLELKREEKLRAVEELLEHYRIIRGSEESMEKKRISIKVYRTSD